jgi:uncharacterized membrane protein YphA (DoxX/SURF4 family)
MYKILPAGRFLLAAPMLIFPIFHYLYPTGVAGIIPPWIPGRLFLNYFTAVTIQAAGLAFVLLIPKYTRLAALLLGVEILLFTLLIHTFLIFPIPGVAWGTSPDFGDIGGRLINCFKEVGMTGACFIFAGILSESWPAGRSNFLFTTGRIILGISVTAFGLLHFLYPVFGPGIPPMRETVGFPLPGHAFWVYLTGVALDIGGLCILTNTRVRQVGVLLGMMVLVFCLLTYIPRFVANPGGEWGGGYLKDLGIAGGLLILARA